jgi:DNA polymerase III subunit epsilon
VREVKRIAILDTETTGTDPENDLVIEVAVALFDLESKCVRAQFSSLIRGALSNNAYSINRIPSMWLEDAPLAEDVWRRVGIVIDSADAFVAHQAAFDRSFTPEPLRSSRPWVCSKRHIEWPESKPGDALVHVALAHGVGVFSAHRAMTDVDTLARVFQAVGRRCNLVDMLRLAMRPRVRVISLAPFEQKDVVKSFGFEWIPDKKYWVGEVFEEDVERLPFKTRRAL